jgi:hypothetical protein
MIRPAVATDVEAIALLARQRREEYEIAQPQFWRVAEHAVPLHKAFLAHMIESDEVESLVAVDGDELLGYVFAAIGPAPPVYDPGGPTASIDDYTVATDDLWRSVGIELCREMRVRLTERGAVQLVVVCGHHDEAKRSALRELELSLASEWYVGPLDSGA